jgi:hypothetical protein
MAFIRIRTIKGRQYRYLEERYREGKKVRSRSRCLGAIGAAISGVVESFKSEETYNIEKWLPELNAKMEAAKARQLAAEAGLTLKFGFRKGTDTPVPIEKVPAQTALPTPAEPPATPETDDTAAAE